MCIRDRHRRGLKKVFPHHIDIESAGNGWYDDTLEGIDPVELGNGDKILDDQKLCRYHHGGKTAEEEDVYKRQRYVRYL